MDSDNEPSIEFVRQVIPATWTSIHELENILISYGGVQAFGYPSLEYALCINESFLEIQGRGTSRQVRLARSSSAAASSSLGCTILLTPCHDVRQTGLLTSEIGKKYRSCDLFLEGQDT